MSLLDRQKEFVGYLTKGFPDLGLKPISAVGAYAIVGNGSVENNMLPVTTGAKDHGSDGVLQWRLDRLTGPTGLKGWAAARGLSWNTLETQAAFTLWELKQVRYTDLLADLVAGTRPLDDLTAAFCWEFERPAKASANIPLRQRHARSIQKIMQQEAIPPALQNAVNGPWSTLFGLLCGLVSWFKFDTVDNENWLLWGAMGVLAIFFIGGKQPPVEPMEDVPPLEKQEKSMIDAPTFTRLIQIAEIILPALDKILTDLETIKTNQQQQAQQQAQPATADPNMLSALDRVQGLVNSLSTKIQQG